MTKHFLIFSVLLLPMAGEGQSSQSPAVITRVSARLYHQIAEIAPTARGIVGVSVSWVETGVSVSWHGAERFPMQSVYKVPIGMTVLHRIDQGKLALNQVVSVSPTQYVSDAQRSPLRDKFPTGAKVTVSELLRYAVSESDGSASDVLLRLIGGPSVAMAYLKTLGITGVRIANTEKEIGSDPAVQYRNWAQPNEAVALLKALQQGRGLSASGRTVLLRLMTDTQTGLNRLKGRLPTGTVVAHKTGSSLTVDNVTAATNDIGLITLPNGQHIAIAVFVSDAKADSAAREAVIARSARAVWDAWK